MIVDYFVGPFLKHSFLFAIRDILIDLQFFFFLSFRDSNG